jgi:hypothetical protein
VIPVVAFTRTSTSPTTATTAFATVSGDGWIDVDAIRLQGSAVPLTVTWTDNNSWTLQLPLRPGNQTYTLEALNKDGAVVGSTNVQIDATTGPFPAAAGDVIATEVNYNPPGASDLQEFIELQNIASYSVDLSNCHFDDNGQGIAYTFPNGTILAPGARILVIRDTTAFSAAYPTAAPVAPGVFVGALDNSGEEITLFAANGTEIFRFIYNDSMGSTDGGGKTLIRQLAVPPNPTDYTWRPSVAAGGNPGTTDAATFPAIPTDDLDKDGLTALVEYAFGTSDTAFTPLTDILEPNGTNEPNLTSPLENADAVTVQLEWSTDLVMWQNPTLDARGYWRVRVTRR